MVTTASHVALGVSTADCGPILFADGEARVIGAAHAGWKGAFTGIVGATVTAMEKLGARRERITAVLGPTISAKAYEVGPEFSERFKAENRTYARFFTPSERAAHAMFDLPAFIGLKAQEAESAASSIWACAPMATSSASSAIGARPIAASPITAA